MRKSRVTFKGAYHHVISRALGGEPIFAGVKAKKYLHRLLADSCKRLRIKLFAYCLMDNHYHLILQNFSGRLADFMRQINGDYALYYRKRHGGRGYVFQDRYKSLVIQKDNYLELAIIYVLLNPVRARLVKNPFAYRWSSINDYFNAVDCSVVDCSFVEDLFGARENMRALLHQWLGKELPVTKTPLGDLVGRPEFIDEVIKSFDRRKKINESMRMRAADFIFEPVDQVLSAFEQKQGVRIGQLDVSSHAGKFLRNELLVLLKDRAGLRYKEIMHYPLFKSLKYSSLGKLYKRARKKSKRYDNNHTR